MQLRSIFFSLLVFFASIATCHGTPFLYTFEGEVQFINVYQDPNNISPSVTTSYSVAGMEINRFDPITYSLVIDINEEGFCAPAGSLQCNFSDGIAVNQPYIDYFYVGLASASIKIPINWFDTSLHYGLKLSNVAGQVFQTTLNAGSSVTIKTSDFFLFPPANDISKDITLWDSPNIPLVSGLLGLDNWNGLYNEELYIGTMYSLLDLVSIEPIIISEPSIFFIMLLGVFLLFLFVSPKVSANLGLTFQKGNNGA